MIDVEAESPSQKIVEGRAGIASMMTLIDLGFGTRILGAVVAEDAGERFEDWHFNRQLGSTNVGWEPQLDAQQIERQHVQKWASTSVDRLMKLPDEDRRRIALASGWFQMALAATDRVIEFLNLWFAIEVLAMEGTDIKPLRDLLVQLTGRPEDELRSVVGRLFGTRSEIVHGKHRTVSDDDLALVEAISRLLLANTFGLEHDEDTDRLVDLLDYRAP